MTDGAAKLLNKHLSSHELDPLTGRVIQDAYDRLTSRDPNYAWTSGQWMTERKGGSDVSGTETIATYLPIHRASFSETPHGPWSIDGFKWFSSATDSSMTVLLAQTPNGLSTFFAPMRRPVSSSSASGVEPERELNGIFIQRLKNKFGTKSLPTAELELKDTRAYLIGKEGQGIQEISTILNISRLWSALSAVGYLGRGLAIAKSFAAVREVGAGRGKRVMLRDAPLHMNTLAKVTGEYHGMMLFVFFVAWLVGVDEHPNGTSQNSPAQSLLRPDNPADVSLLLRVLTPILKASVCKRSTHALQECMEALGGVGYLDNVENESLNIARLYRDCCVQSIWEGTTDVLASDTLRVLKGRNGDDVIGALERWIKKGLDQNKLSNSELDNEKKVVLEAWFSVRDTVKAGNAEALLQLARDLLFKLADVVIRTLLVVDAQRDADPAILHICSRILTEAGVAKEEVLGGGNGWKENLEINQRIVYGSQKHGLVSNVSKL
jgi:alkylation response protein AidB-like acyl-CoA dehydrogenase